MPSGSSHSPMRIPAAPASSREARTGKKRSGTPTVPPMMATARSYWRSEEHTSELQSLRHLVCRLLLEKKKKGPDITSYPFVTSGHASLIKGSDNGPVGLSNPQTKVSVISPLRFYASLDQQRRKHIDNT